MAQYIIHKAVELSACSSKFKKLYPDLDSLVKAGYWLQPKYDGCCGIAVITPQGATMLSRTGEDYSASCAHILDELVKLGNKAGLPDFVVIGEVWALGAAFKDISGAFRRQTQGTQQHLSFVANDLLLGFEFVQGVSDRPYKERHEYLTSLVSDELATGCVWAASCTKEARLLLPTEYAKHLISAGGYDGAILRHPEGQWIVAGNGTGGEIIKVKPAKTWDLMVIGVTCGKGKYENTLGALIVKRKDGTQFEVSGMTDAERDAWWADPDLIIGRIVEVEAMGEYPSGKLREPRYKGIRFDKKEPD